LDANVNVAAAYVQTKVDLTSRLFLTAGARFDFFDRSVDFNATSSSDASTVEDSDHHVSPKLSLSYRFGSHVVAYASFGEGFSPGFGPVWSFGSRNTTLRPEVARNYEAGLKGEVLDRRLFFAASGYWLDRRDLILLIPDGPGTRTINAGKQRSRGFEWESKFDLSVGWRLSGYFNYSFTDSEWVNNRYTIEFSNTVYDFSGKTVRSIPEHLWSLGLTKGFANGISGRVWFDYTGDYYFTPDNRLRGGGFGLLNASVSVPFSDQRWEAQVAATNVTDKRYYYFAGYGDGALEAYPGVPFELSARLKFRF
jgi:iron complex outermembrane receptor protein